MPANVAPGYTLYGCDVCHKTFVKCDCDPVPPVCCGQPMRSSRA